MAPSRAYGIGLMPQHHRTSQELRPSSPLSPRSPRSPRLESSAMSSHHQSSRRRLGAMSQRAGNAPRLPPSAVQLPSMPRFHPANFPSPSHHSASSSGLNSPATASGQHQPTASQRATQRHRDLDVQRQMYMYQREIATQTSRGLRGGVPIMASSEAGEPISPRLIPLGSPGPITPLDLELERSGQGYFVAQSSRTPTTPKLEQDDYFEGSDVREDGERLGGYGSKSGSPKSPSAR